MLTDYESQIKKLPHGEPRLQMHRAAVKEADEDGNFIYRLYRRYEYIRESEFHGDFMEALTEFPKMMQIFDEEEAKGGTDREDAYTLLWAFKWILGGCQYYYQVTTEQFEAFLAEYKKRMIRYGYSLRTYYGEKMKYYSFINPKVEEENYHLFIKQRRDSMSDCEACDRDSVVQYYLGRGEVDKAREKAQPLFDRKLYCGEVPEITYKAFTLYNCKQLALGNEIDMVEADRFCTLIANPIRYSCVAIEGFGVPMIYYAMTNTSKALSWYKRFWPTFESMRNPTYKFYFAIGAVLFFQKRSKETYKMQLASNFPFYNEENVYNVKQLIQYYYDFAKDYATKLDARNGTSDFMDELNLFCGEVLA